MPRRTHGKTGTSEHIAWGAMKERCQRKTHPAYKDYGGRGIHVCQQWLNSFEQFLKDMGPKPPGVWELDRIDNLGNYEPQNCRWATKKQQARNRRNNILITYQGTTQTMAAWAEQIGMSRQKLKYRLKAGWPTEKALAKPKPSSA